MIYNDQNKEDDRMINDLSNRARDLQKDDADFKRSEYGTSIFQTGVHLSRIDSETGYDDYDPRDIEPDEPLEEEMKQYNIVPHGSGASHIPSEFTNLLSVAYFTRQRMLEQGQSDANDLLNMKFDAMIANEVH